MKLKVYKLVVDGETMVETKIKLKLETYLLKHRWKLAWSIKVYVDEEVIYNGHSFARAVSKLSKV